MTAMDALCFAMVVSLLVDYHAFAYELPVLAIPLMLFLKRCPSAVVFAWAICGITFCANFVAIPIFCLFCPLVLALAIWMSWEPDRTFTQATVATA